MSDFVPNFGQVLPLAPEATGEAKVIQQKTYRLADIQKMSATEYAHKMATDPDFAKAVDSFFVAPTKTEEAPKA